jgi:hypothetical protein
MNNSNPNHVSDRDPLPLEPDFDWIAGKKRAVLPRTKLRAIPLIGSLVGLVCALIAKSIFPTIFDGNFTEFPAMPTILCIGVLLGGGIGGVIYQVLAHRATQTSGNPKQ